MSLLGRTRNRRLGHTARLVLGYLAQGAAMVESGWIMLPQRGIYEKVHRATHQYFAAHGLIAQHVEDTRTVWRITPKGLAVHAQGGQLPVESTPPE